MTDAKPAAPMWPDAPPSIWVTAYELRFPEKDESWPQVSRRSFATEKEARDYVASVEGKYQICRVELPSSHAAQLAAAEAAGASAMRRHVERSCNNHGDTLARNGLPASAISVARTCAVIVGTLPIPHATALAAALDAARKEGAAAEREACIALTYAELNTATTEGEQDAVGNVIDAIRARSNQP